MTRRPARAVLAVLSVSAVVLAGQPTHVAGATGLDPVHCSPLDGRIPFPDDLTLDACFDGDVLLVINRTSLPALLSVEGDVRLGAKRRTAGAAPWASVLFDPLDPSLLLPGYEMALPVGAGTGSVRIAYDAEIARQYGLADLAAGVVPGVAGVPQVFTQFLREADTALVDYVRCRDAARGVFGAGGCALGFGWDVEYAAGRLVVNGVLSVAQVKQLITAIQLLAETTRSVNDVAKDLVALRASTNVLTVPAEAPAPAAVPPVLALPAPAPATGPVAPPAAVAPPEAPGAPPPAAVAPPEAPGAPPPAAADAPPAIPPADPSGSVLLSIAGSCDSDGGELSGTASKLTPGGTAAVAAWRPDGTPYTGIVATARVRQDGTFPWTWPCTGDAPGGYTTEVVDTATGRSSGRVPFVVGAPPAPQPPPPLPQPDAPSSAATVADHFLGGTWAKADPTGELHGQDAPPGNATAWLPNGATVTGCSQRGGAYAVKWADGRTEIWSWWLRLSDGSFVATAATQEGQADGPLGPVCA